MKHEMTPLRIVLCEGVVSVMTTYPVFFYDTQVGQVGLEPAGLYEKVTVRLSDPGQLVRIILVGERDSLLLGTALPENGALVCRRTVSRRSLPGGILGAVALTENESWQVRGDTLLRLGPDQAEIAQRYVEAEPVEGVEQYPRLQPEQINGQDYLICRYSLGEFLHRQLEKL